jgi:hypothetical protein
MHSINGWTIVFLKTHGMSLDGHWLIFFILSWWVDKHKTKEILIGIATNTVIQVMHNDDQYICTY